MTALSWFGLGFLILLLLPNIVLAMDDRPTPAPYHVGLALFGLLYSGLALGPIGALVAALSGLAWIFILTFAVANTQNRFGYRTMSGSEIRLFGASATWLSPALTFAALLLCLLAIAVALVLRRRDISSGKRPKLVFFITVSIFLTFCYHLGS